MGLSIHYDGKLKNGSDLKELLNEVAETCKTFDWYHEIFNDEFPRSNSEKILRKHEVYGMAFTPPDCETVFLCFEPDGTMKNPLWKMLEDDSDDELKEITTTSVKTQSAGIETHKQIINLFKYLEKKYFSEFSMYDESGFWDHGDLEKLREKMVITERTVKLIEERLNTKRLEGEKLEDFVVRAYNNKRNQRQFESGI